MASDINTITEGEAELKGLLNKEGEYSDEVMTAEYGDPNYFFNDLDKELRKRGLRLVIIEDGMSDYSLFIDAIYSVKREKQHDKQN